MSLLRAVISSWGCFDAAALVLEEIAPEDKNRNEVLGARVNRYMAAAVASHLVKVDPETIAHTLAYEAFDFCSCLQDIWSPYRRSLSKQAEDGGLRVDEYEALLGLAHSVPTILPTRKEAAKEIPERIPFAARRPYQGCVAKRPIINYVHRTWHDFAVAGFSIWRLRPSGDQLVGQPQCWGFSILEAQEVHCLDQHRTGSRDDLRQQDPGPRRVSPEIPTSFSPVPLQLI